MSQLLPKCCRWGWGGGRVLLLRAQFWGCTGLGVSVLVHTGCPAHPGDAHLQLVGHNPAVPWEETTTRPHFIPFSSTLLHPKSQLLTQKTPNLAQFGARADSCQSVPPHRCREPVPKPPAPARLSPHPAPFWLIPLGRELIGIYLTAPSASRAISLSLLGRRRRREPAEGARFSPFPVPSCSFPS